MVEQLLDIADGVMFVAFLVGGMAAALTPAFLTIRWLRQSGRFDTIPVCCTVVATSSGFIAAGSLGAAVSPHVGWDFIIFFVVYVFTVVVAWTSMVAYKVAGR